MASIWTNSTKGTALAGIAATSGLKWMLVSGVYVPNPDDAFASVATANEISATGYVPGYGNSGRKALAGITVTVDLANDYAYLNCNALTWTAVDSGQAIEYALLIQEAGGSDTTSPLLAAITCSLLTNGSDFTLTPSATGVLLIT